MYIADNVLRQRLQNVYFIWGAGKTTIANRLQEMYGCYVYHTDYERARHARSASLEYQPALCRDVPDYWSLEPEDAKQWERDIVREFTPMVVADLLVLATQHKYVICEGDIDIDQICPIAVHAVTISNHGNSYDFFSRPDQQHMLYDIQNRSDLSDEEKAERIKRAYEIVENSEIHDIPYETLQYGITEVVRYDDTPVHETAALVAAHFGFL